MSMRSIYRILDANLNRAREALRVIEDAGRFALNDPIITATAKAARSELTLFAHSLPEGELLAGRDTPGDLGTGLVSDIEGRRDSIRQIAEAACKRLEESLRTLEEYAKLVAPAHAVILEKLRYDSYTMEKRLLNRLDGVGRFAEVKLYVLISSEFCKGSVLETARAVLAGGAQAVQLREKNIPDDQLLALAAELRELTQEMGRLLIINDRADIAAIVSADGLHLGQTDIPITEARKLLPPGAMIGKSTHTPQQIHAALNEGADYIAVGPMFPTQTKDRPVVGPQLLAEARGLTADTHTPLVAIGGITPENVDELTQGGPVCIAVCGGILKSGDPKAATTQFIEKLK